MSAAQVVPIRGTLYEIAEHLEALFDSEDMCETAEEQAAIQADIALYIELEIRKVDSVASYLAFCANQQDFATAEIKRIQERKATFERRENRLKACVIAVMELQQLRKLEGRTSTLSLRACPVSVDTFDESVIPSDFRIIKTTETISKTAIKAAIEAGRDVPGARLVTNKMSLVRK